MKLFIVITTSLGLAAALPTANKLVPSTNADAVPQVAHPDDITTDKRDGVCHSACQEAYDSLKSCNEIPSCGVGPWWRPKQKAYDDCCMGPYQARSENTVFEAVAVEPAVAGDPAGSPADYVDPTGES